MTKKATILFTSVILIILLILIFIFNNGNTIKDENVINTIRTESNLDILVNLGNYSTSEYSDEKLLDVSMQLANKLGLLNEYSDESNYIQYVTKDELHSIIFELTGITIEAPIEIEDFYYLYDSENDYYYYRPATPTYFSINKIDLLEKNGSNYTITCSISKKEDLETTTIENVQISLTKMSNNSLVKYKVNEVCYELVSEK